MTKLEQLKTAYEAVPKATWKYDNDLSAVVYVSGMKLKVAADFGKIDDSEANADFIALAHNLMPALLEAVEALRELKEAVEYTPLGVRGITCVAAGNAILEKLK